MVTFEDREQPSDASSSLAILPLWNSQTLQEHIRSAQPDSEVRVQTTSFMNIDRMQTSFEIAMDKGARICLLMSDPNCAVFRARHRLRSHKSFSKYREAALEHQQELMQLTSRKSKGSCTIQLTDLMPFGFYAQGNSKDHGGPWMFVGFMPSTNSYIEGPMIKVRPEATDVWRFFESSWKAGWEHPLDPEATAK